MVIRLRLPPPLCLGLLLRAELKRLRALRPCPSIPQAVLTQRRYITAWFKFAGYYHLLRRFDEFDEDEREKLTPIVLLADEGQNSILAAEEGLADHNTLDKIREARGTLRTLPFVVIS